MKTLRSILTILFILVLLSIPSVAQVNEPDASIVISQDALNKFLLVVGEVKKTDNFSILGIKGEYTWMVKNPRINLTSGKAQFLADVTVSIKNPSLTYSVPAHGDVSIRYDLSENKINIKVEKVAFDVAFTILGKKITVGEVDLSKIYQIAFSFPGPKPFETTTEVSLPDGSRKKIRIESIPVLTIDEGKIVVGSQINYIPVE
ncbi:MAG TPA: hypothetical protein PKW23_06955 [Dictyoglomaceae bacterium]|nr:hypothetical protein [Dictyoglomaceae bacterium]HOL40140.1 hypothetical protein [Dictyoglomaceae bacterium]HPP16511.1 hypothetical protein [Dictyoglomaceae bacterium]